MTVQKIMSQFEFVALLYLEQELRSFFDNPNVDKGHPDQHCKPVQGKAVELLVR